MDGVYYNIQIDKQPTETTCGPTCLKAILKFHNIESTMPELIAEVPVVEGGGTLGVHLALAAIKKGLKVKIYSYNLHVFDPIWFELPPEQQVQKLILQSKTNKTSKTKLASLAYADFIKHGGAVEFAELSPDFLASILQNHGPVICGVSATYLYRAPREISETNSYDDVNGVPQGHFIVVNGISNGNQQVKISDPYDQNPLSDRSKYEASTHRLIGSLLTGIVTYDANLITFTK